MAQSLASLSINRAIQVCAHLDPLVSERWNSITLLLTRYHQCRRLVKKAVHVLLCLCNNACKRSLAICRKSRALARVPLACFCLTLYSLHVLNRDVNMIQTNKKPYAN